MSVRLSVAVMAHKARAPFVDELLPRLGLGPEAVVWDRYGDRWDTGRRALLAYDRSATHHLVVQDDARVCRDLRRATTLALTARPHVPVSLYTGKVRPNGPVFVRMAAEAASARAAWLAWPALAWGVGVVLPVELIEPIVEFADRQANVPNYDTRISTYLEAHGIPVFYTFPSLVDHRAGPENPSLVPGRSGANRVAHRFVGTGGASRIDWYRPTVIDARAFALNGGLGNCWKCDTAAYGCTSNANGRRAIMGELINSKTIEPANDPMVVVPAEVSGRPTRLRLRRSEAIARGLLEATPATPAKRPVTTKKRTAKNKARAE